jgi:cell division septation protein DedD
MLQSTQAETAQTRAPSRLELLAMQAEREAKQGINNTMQTASNVGLNAVETKDNEAAKQASGNASKTEQPIIVTTAPVTVETTAPVKATNTSSSAVSTTTTLAGSNVTTPKTYSAGSSPETLAFVKSVLDKKDQVKTGSAYVAKKPMATPNTSSKTATALSKVSPAAGKDRSDIIAIKPGTYYVQLASVKTQSGAHSEWGKLKGKYSPLSRSDYRVTRADLGEKGIFFRIQAGPMSKSSASDVCNSIKQSAGSCFITQ